MTTTPVGCAAGRLLRQWRHRRRLSQLDLANLAEISTRHLSYLETGRARPSREMVLRLGVTLELPLAERNALLLAAGHAPAFADTRRDAAATRYLLEIVDLALAAHDPWPALVLDAEFDVVATNSSLDRLVGLVDADLLDPPINAVRIMLHPRGLFRYIVNKEEWHAHLLREVRQHVAVNASSGLLALLREAESFAVPPQDTKDRPSSGPTFALPLELQVADRRLRLFSTVATFGTPLDVAASELAIETFLPADVGTRDWFTSQPAQPGEG